MEVAKVTISIPPNPSHLEAVNAVVQVKFQAGKCSTYKQLASLPALKQASLKSPRPDSNTRNSLVTPQSLGL